MKQYLEVLKHVKNEGLEKTDPHGVGNIATCGNMMRFKVEDGFPLLTTRNLRGSLRAMIFELFWFLRGKTTIKYLNDNGVHTWDQWATPEICQQMGLETGDLGPTYPKQWRAFSCGDGVTVDQVVKVVGMLRENPDSRRLIVTSWNPKEVEEVFVAPCHCFYQFFHAQGKLTLHVYQRSADMPVGVAFDIPEYMLYLMMVAQVVGLEAYELVYTLSDSHIYMDQIDGVEEQLLREPRKLPTMTINPEVKNIFDFSFDDFKLSDDYHPHPRIKYPVAL